MFAFMILDAPGWEEDKKILKIEIASGRGGCDGILLSFPCPVPSSVCLQK